MYHVLYISIYMKLHIDIIDKYTYCMHVDVSILKPKVSQKPVERI